MKHQQDDKSSQNYINWWKLHKPSCLTNHSGSSNSMESEGTCEIFLRSIEKNSLKYCQFVSDRDTGSYGKVRGRLGEAFGDKYIVVKEECVGHVQKRLGSGLRELKRKQGGTKLSDGKVIGGKGRLTDKTIDIMQNYFGEAIGNNVGSVESMENDIWATFKHMIEDNSQSLDEQHSLCPKDS